MRHYLGGHCIVLIVVTELGGLIMNEKFSLPLWIASMSNPCRHICDPLSPIQRLSIGGLPPLTSGSLRLQASNHSTVDKLKELLPGLCRFARPLLLHEFLQGSQKCILHRLLWEKHQRNPRNIYPSGLNTAANTVANATNTSSSCH